MRSLCNVEGCGRAIHSGGLCQLHKRRMQAHGDVSATNRRRNADGKGYRNAGDKGMHVVVAERALGKPLPSGAQVHHIDEDRSNNAPTNLVVCPSAKYHQLLHSRQRAFEATGDYNKLKCRICLEYDDASNLTVLASGRAYHAACNRAHAAKHQRNRYGIHV